MASESKEKKTPVKKTTVAKKTPTKKVATAKTTTTKKPAVKKTTTTKKVAAPAKKVVEKKEEVVKAPKVVEEKKVEVKKVKKEKQIVDHFGVYLFLLIAVSLCIYVMGRFELNIGSVTVGYSVLLFSSVFFITNVITKKFDFKRAIIAILSTVLSMVVFVFLMKYLNNKVFDYYVIYGEIFAFLISQLLNLIIYYYLLVNTEVKARWIFLTYMFATAAFYFIALLFSTRIVITDNFYVTLACSVVLSSIMAVMYSLFDSFIKRGVEVE